MESWRMIWREAAAALFSTAGLEALATALVGDDPRLLQGATTTPTPLQCTADWPMEAGDLFAFAAWQGDGLETVEECEEYFARCCYEIDQKIGEPAACRHLLNFWDESPRDEVRRLLLPEVRRILAQRVEMADAV